MYIPYEEPADADQTFYHLGLSVQEAVSYIRRSHGNSRVFGRIEKGRRSLDGQVLIRWPAFERFGVFASATLTVGMEVSISIFNGLALEVVYRVSTQQEIVAVMMRALGEKLHVPSSRLVGTTRLRAFD